MNASTERQCSPNPTYDYTPTLRSLPLWAILRQPRSDGCGFFTRVGLEQGVTYRREGLELSRGELWDWINVVDMNHVGLW